MKKNNIVREKAFAFAIRIVRLYSYLSLEKQEYVLSKQVLRSGTSIGANIEESLGGQTDKDFLFKLTISYKEARETMYWIRLLVATGYITASQAATLQAEAEELCKLLASIQITLKKKAA